MKTYFLLKLRNNSNEVHSTVEAIDLPAALDFFREDKPDVKLDAAGYWREDTNISWTVAELYQSYYPRPH